MSKSATQSTRCREIVNGLLKKLVPNGGLDHSGTLGGGGGERCDCSTKLEEVRYWSVSMHKLGQDSTPSDCVHQMCTPLDGVTPRQLHTSCQCSSSCSVDSETTRNRMEIRHNGKKSGGQSTKYPPLFEFKV